MAATGLRGHDLTGFLNALDVSECAAGSRFRSRERVILTIAKIMEDNVAGFMTELRQRVRDLMLPERHRDAITFETVLSWFGVADRAGLFPCPSEIAPVPDPVARHAASELADTMMRGAKLIRLHGPGGCGKTTVLHELSSLLPEGSCVVLFDCYGGGRYRFSDDKRHLPEHAFLQIANDLAVSLGTPFFIPRSAHRPTEVRQFLKRIREAAMVVEDGLLVIGIDAADNAVTAAELVSGSKSCLLVLRFTR